MSQLEITASIVEPVIMVIIVLAEVIKMKCPIGRLLNLYVDTLFIAISRGCNTLWLRHVARRR